MKATGLYRYYDADERLLYVGVALNPIARLYRHRNEKPWVYEIAYISVEWFPSRIAAFGAERSAIKSENPKYNCLDMRSPNGENLHAERTRAGFDAKRRAGHIFGRRHSIKDNPKRLAAFRPYIESGEAMTMRPTEALRVLNAADPRGRKITSQETFRRWRRDGFPGIVLADELSPK